MNEDRRSQALKDLGVRTWRGAAIFGLQALALFLPIAIIMKVIGEILGLEAIVSMSWWRVLFTPIKAAASLFIAVAIYTWLHNLMNK